MVSSMKHCRDQAEVPLSLSLSLGAVAERKKKLGQRAAAVGGEEDGEFVCKTCGRSFPTFQALGGHRTSHLRGRHGLALALAGDHYSGKAKKATSTDDQRPAAVHQCHVCGLGFEMGQALGGHMAGTARRPAPCRRRRPFCSSCLSSSISEELQQVDLCGREHFWFVPAH